MINVKRTYGLCVLTFFLWGSVYVFSKYAFSVFTPLTVLLIRNSIAAVVVYLLGRKKGFKKVERVHIKYFLITGILGYFVCNGMVLEATSLMSATGSSLINASNPVFIILFAVLLLKETMTVNKAVGILCALVGVVLVIGLQWGEVSALGAFFAVCAVILGALGSVMIRKVTPYYSPEQVTFCCFVTSLPFCLIGSFVENAGKQISITPSALAAVLYIGIFATGIANYLWNRSLAAMDASTCSMFYPLQSVFAALLGIVLLGEPVTANFVIGGVLIFAGVLIGLGAHKRIKPW